MKSGTLSDVLRIALPMTLNNLAGGAAGGASGIDAKTSGLAALVASFCMMKLGHVMGSNLMRSVDKRKDSTVVSGSIFACLAALQLIQLFHN